jgi:hypothetical protein
MILVNRLEQSISLEVGAPDAALRGGCAMPFGGRFCAEEYDVIGVLDVSAGQDRIITISDPVTDEQCTNLLWLRLVFLEDVGPVDDRGTLIQLPADVEVETGAGALHTVAYPQATVRIDEVGTLDANQARPPPPCAELGREPR